MKCEDNSQDVSWEFGDKEVAELVDHASIREVCGAWVLHLGLKDWVVGVLELEGVARNLKSGII